MSYLIQKAGSCLLIQLMVIVAVSSAQAQELKSRYATICFENTALLKKFNTRLYMGQMRYLLDSKKNITIGDEVINKIDVITKKVEQVLEMSPPNLHYKIVLCPSIGAVTDSYENIYRKRTRYPCFYSPRENTVFISVRNLELRMLAHEIGHVVVENYFKVSPPVKIHEVLAQFAEMHVTD